MVPFVSLALALAVANLPWLLLALVVAHAITCWPAMYLTYCAPDAFRIEDVPVEAALRLQSEEAYLSQDPEYKIVRMIGRVVPPGDRIFAIGQGGKSYFPRELLIGYESAANEVLQDILWTPVVRASSRRASSKFDFPAARAAQIASGSKRQRAAWINGPWPNCASLTARDELPRDPGWRLTAHPNPWEVQLAFDNSPVTRWRSWQPAFAGDVCRSGFRPAASASSVVVESSSDDGEHQDCD